MPDMIDAQGFRSNVGIVVAHPDGRVLWGKRIGQDAWQFPQGGVLEGETFREAAYRELTEEVGLLPEHVELVAVTNGWIRYRLPRRYIRFNSKPVCIGQKQKWFLFRLIADDSAINLKAGEIPEFDEWAWVNYWYPLQQVIAFKRAVYRRALRELAHHIFSYQYKNRKTKLRKKKK